MSKARSYPPNRRRLPGRPPYVVATLRRKYAELKGRGDTEAMTHVGATLLLFAPGEDLSAIAAIRPHKVNGEHWSRTALGILRKASTPLSAPDLARMVIETLGRDQGDKRLYMSVLCSLHATLGKLEGDVLERVGDEPKRWALATEAGNQAPHFPQTLVSGCRSELAVATAIVRSANGPSHLPLRPESVG